MLRMFKNHRVVVSNRKAIDELLRVPVTVDYSWHLLSIANANSIVFNIKDLMLMGCQTALSISFADVTDEKNPNCFTNEHATAVINFLDNVKINDKILIHCDAGISRSATIAQFTQDYLDIKEAEIKYLNPPNFNHLIRKVLFKSVGFSYHNDVANPYKNEINTQ